MKVKMMDNNKIESLQEVESKVLEIMPHYVGLKLKIMSMHHILVMFSHH